MRSAALLLIPHSIKLLLLPTSAAQHAINAHKAPLPTTPPGLVSAWSAKDAALHTYIADHVPSVLEHTGSEAFDSHLRGVQALLRGWGADEEVAAAGLFHSIYGTEGFQGFSLPLSERDTIRGLIGDKAEKLCWIFCMVDRSTVDSTVFAWTSAQINTNTTYTFTSRPELGRFDITLTKEEWVDFIELTLADWLEQVQGAAEKPSHLFLWDIGEAYAYRRRAYAKMAEILTQERKERLGQNVLAAVKDVYGTESVHTRHLVQERTPPMSEAARYALDALRGNGEDIPLDFAPIPQDKGSEDCRAGECTK